MRLFGVIKNNPEVEDELLKKSHFTILRAKRATFIFLVDIFEFSRQKSTLQSKSTILMIFGAKIQIFQKLTIELKKMPFWA